MSDAKTGGGDPRVKTRIRATRTAAALILVGLLFVAPLLGRQGLAAEFSHTIA